MRTLIQYLLESIDYDNVDERIKLYEREKKDAVSYNWEDARARNLTGKFFDKFVYYLDDGNIHRVDGPAIIWPEGSCFWYKNGKVHRVDGPAIVRNSYSQKEWWFDGIHFTTFVPGGAKLFHYPIPIDIQWKFIHGNVNNIEAIKSPAKEIQQYVLKRNPYLINKIHHIDLELKKQYSDISVTKGLGI